MPGTFLAILVRNFPQSPFDRTEEPTRVLGELTQKALAEGRELEALEVRRPSLEDVYLALLDEEDDA